MSRYCPTVVMPEVPCVRWGCTQPTVYSRTIIILPLTFLVTSEECCWGDNPLQIFIRDRLDEGDSQFISDKPVRLL